MATVIPMFDRLRDFVTGLGGERDRTTTQSFDGLYLVTQQEIEIMYRQDWLARKIVDIVPQDMVRLGRRWQAEAQQITAIEDLENSRAVQLWAKVREALVRARLTGGSGIFIGVDGQASSTPLDPESVRPGSLKYLTVIDRFLLSYQEVDRDPQSPWYGQPKMWSMRAGDREVYIHPSRLVRFVGAPIMSSQSLGYIGTNGIASGGANDGVWGDSILQIVYEAVKNAASVQQHVAGLVPDSRNDVIYVPGLGEILNNPVDRNKLINRFSHARTMKSMFNMLLLEGNGISGAGSRGEQWQQRQVSFTQLPELMRQYLQIAAGAADIPVTRLLGESPAGENATGEADLRNYYDHVAALQKLNVSPALQIIDEVTKRSAGVEAKTVFYRWTPLWALTETEKAEVFSKKAKAARDLIGGTNPIIHPYALSESLVNDLTEDGVLPGLEASVKKHGEISKVLPEDKIVPDEPEPQLALPKPGDGKPVVDAAPRTLYVYRQLLNTSEFVQWASDSGIVGIQPSDELHVTVLYSKTPVDWLKMGADMWSGYNGKITVPPGGPRVVEQLGETATVLSFASSMLSWRHREMIEAGASSEYDEYVAHVTISHQPQVVDLSKVRPFQGQLRFGPEIFEEVDENWRQKVGA